jgi:hypothetical protein
MRAVMTFAAAAKNQSKDSIDDQIAGTVAARSATTMPLPRQERPSTGRRALSMDGASAALS